MNVFHFSEAELAWIHRHKGFVSKDGREVVFGALRPRDGHHGPNRPEFRSSALALRDAFKASKRTNLTAKDGPKAPTKKQLELMPYYVRENKAAARIYASLGGPAVALRGNHFTLATYDARYKFPLIPE